MAETKRHEDSIEVFDAMIRETYDNIQLVVPSHHLVFKQHGEPPQEAPSADYLIFNHEIARKVWGGKWREVLTALALEPTETRDALLYRLYYGREKK